MNTLLHALNFSTTSFVDAAKISTKKAIQYPWLAIVELEDKGGYIKESTSSDFNSACTYLRNYAKECNEDYLFLSVDDDTYVADKYLNYDRQQCFEA